MKGSRESPCRIRGIPKGMGVVVGRYFPGGPVAKTSPANAEGTSLIPGQGAKIRSHMPWDPKTKT